MDTSIEKCQKTAVTASDKSRKLIRKHSEPSPCNIEKEFPPSAKPTLEWHDTVVIHVEEGQVGELLLQHEEEWVEHVKELGDVEDPGKVERPDGLRIVWVVDGLAGPAVVTGDVESVTFGD